MDYLSVERVAQHFDVRPQTVRVWLGEGTLQGVRVGRLWRLRWEDVWRAERGPAPTPSRAARYRTPLLNKRALARRYAVSTRTVERWLTAGLPTRSVGRLVRINAADADDWICARYGFGPAAAHPREGRTP